MWRNFLSQFNFMPYDMLNLIFVGLLLLLTIIFYPHLFYAKQLIIFYIFLLTFIIFCVFLSTLNTSKKSAYIHYFYPIFLIFFIFQSFDYIIPYLHNHLKDEFLYHLDILIFGVCPFKYLEKWTKPWLTEIMQLGYISYYFMPVILVLILLKKQDKRLPSVIFTILLGFYLSYMGYLIFPAMGPRGLGISQVAVYKDTWLAAKLFKILNLLEKNKTDAFPSGHTQISLICTYFAFYLNKTIGIVFGIMTMFLIFSTVYCRYHYVTDVLAGALLAFISLKIAPYLERLIQSNSLTN
ncbi:MAG TPA: phosphatase PAP2 family protein [Candidatus Desulfofervidus auxilii]|uniref:Phosphatase PAP2 family protein n=1 Tax=Desulfofervidus auxilii TaxID=1621989 RepID=A0A7C0U1K9_DESA2|nr:phosphatase PAP2 family protein [Candidatus Desulfofervidus auxilii]